MRIVVTGSSRGIGLEFVRQYLARGERVEAVARAPQHSASLMALAQANPEKLRPHVCDIADDASVSALSTSLSEGPIDVLINNAGVMGAWQSFEGLDLNDVMHTFSTNALGPIRVTRALLPRLRLGAVKKVVHLSSQMGSIGDNTSGGAYAYRMSKAALNMASKSLALDAHKEGLISVVLSPGWVKTDMGGVGAPTPVETSVAGLIRVIDGLRLEDSGKFLSFEGATVPW